MAYMPESKAQQEPSIEEILSSIRQIINEDDGAPADSASGAPAKPAPMSGNDDDVLDLANLAKPNLVVPPSAPKDSDDLAFENEKSKTPPQQQAPAAPQKQAPASAQPAREAMSDKNEESLISENVLNAAAASLTKLAQAEVMIDHKHAAGIGSVTLEDVVKEMLRPMMKAWLDENLPPLVERLVQREIQKMSQRV